MKECNLHESERIKEHLVEKPLSAGIGSLKISKARRTLVQVQLIQHNLQLTGYSERIIMCFLDPPHAFPPGGLYMLCWLS